MGSSFSVEDRDDEAMFTWPLLVPEALSIAAGQR